MKDLSGLEKYKKAMKIFINIKKKSSSKCLKLLIFLKWVIENNNNNKTAIFHTGKNVTEWKNQQAMISKVPYI